jgi:CheY-like chemotaxis protein
MQKGGGMSKKILLVDDDPALHLTIVPVLNKAGYAVVSAKSGEEALQLISQDHFDLFILDVIMPGMKGRELCEKIKTNVKFKDIPVIFLTVKDSDDDIKAEMKAGAIDHLTKPVNHSYLLKTIETILGK